MRQIDKNIERKLVINQKKNREGNNKAGFANTWTRKNNPTAKIVRDIGSLIGFVTYLVDRQKV